MQDDGNLSDISKKEQAYMLEEEVDLEQIEEVPLPLMAQGPEAEAPSFLDIHSLELARQLTLADYEAFQGYKYISVLIYTFRYWAFGAYRVPMDEERFRVQLPERDWDDQEFQRYLFLGSNRDRIRTKQETASSRTKAVLTNNGRKLIAFGLITHLTAFTGLE